MPASPLWAQDTLLPITVREQFDVLPDLVWWPTRFVLTSGHVTRTFHSLSILIHAGKDPLDQQITLLHACSHWLLAKDGQPGEHHNAFFYGRLWPLLSDVDLPLAPVLRSEGAYRERALLVARRRGLPGAAVLLRQHGAARSLAVSG